MQHFLDNKGPSDNTYSLETLSRECKIGLTAYAKPCNEYSFSLIFPHFLTFLLIFINVQMRYFSYRTRSSIDLSYDITGSITKCHSDSLGLKLFHLWVFKDFLPFLLKLMNMQIR